MLISACKIFNKCANKFISVYKSTAFLTNALIFVVVDC